MKILRIIFTVLAAIAVAAVIPLFALTDAIYGASAVAAALVFACMMLLCKKWQEKKEERENPTPKDPDFFNPIEKDEN